MKRVISSFVFIFFSAALFFLRAEFKIYPGAEIDQQATKLQMEMINQTKQKNLKTTVYRTADSFQKVCAFYSKIGSEFAVARSSGSSGKPKMSDVFGRELWEAYFIFDGAKDIAGSKLWAKVQYPYLCDEEIIDATAIIVTKKE